MEPNTKRIAELMAHYFIEGVASHCTKCQLFKSRTGYLILETAMGGATMGESNKNIVQHAVEEFNRHNLPGLEQMYRDCVFHSTVVGELDAEARRQYVAQLLDAFPDGCWTIQDQVADDDKVVTRWSFSGTHQGMFRGYAGTGRKIAITGIAIDRIVDGRIVEEWEESNISFTPSTSSLPQRS